MQKYGNVVSKFGVANSTNNHRLFSTIAKNEPQKLNVYANEDDPSDFTNTPALREEPAGFEGHDELCEADESGSVENKNVDVLLDGTMGGGQGPNLFSMHKDLEKELMLLQENNNSSTLAQSAFGSIEGPGSGGSAL